MFKCFLKIFLLNRDFTLCSRHKALFSLFLARFLCVLALAVFPSSRSWFCLSCFVTRAVCITFPSLLSILARIRHHNPLFPSTVYCFKTYILIIHPPYLLRTWRWRQHDLQNTGNTTHIHMTQGPNGRISLNISWQWKLEIIK